MTPERKKAVITILTTLIIGILIGALSIGLWSKQGHGGRPTGGRKDGKEAFVKKIFSVIDADSNQAKQIRPYVNEAIFKIDSLQNQTNREVAAVVDSLEIKLRPILSDTQMARLKEFHKRARERGRK